MQDSLEVIQAEVIPSAPKQKQVLDKDGKVDLSLLTQEDKTRLTPLANSLKVDDPNSILDFGVEAHSSISSSSNSLIVQARSFETGEMGKQINNLLSELNYIDPDSLNHSAIQKVLLHIPVLKQLVMNTKKFLQRYDSVAKNIDDIAQNIKLGEIRAKQDNATLQTLYDNFQKFIAELENIIIAGEIRLDEVKVKLDVMLLNPNDYQDYEISDTKEFVSRLDKRIAELKTNRFTTILSLAQIRMIQSNNYSLAEKAKVIVTTTIPVWKGQVTIALTLENQRKSAESQRLISDVTNQMLEQNANRLKINSIEIAKENEKTVISAETLQKVTQSVKETIEEIQRIHSEGAAKRATSMATLATLETDLKKTLNSKN